MASRLTVTVVAATAIGVCAIVQSAAAFDTLNQRIRPHVLLSPKAKAALRFSELDQTFHALENSGAAAVDAAKWGETLAARKSIKNELDSLSEMGEMESLRLQMAMDRLSKMMSTLSNLLKKASETSSGIIQNIK